MRLHALIAPNHEAIMCIIRLVANPDASLCPTYTITPAGEWSIQSSSALSLNPAVDGEERER